MPSRFDVSRLIALYLSGQTYSQVAAVVGCKPGTVKWHLMRSGVVLRPTRINWPVDQMRHWYEVDRMTVEQIANRLGQSRIAVNKACWRYKFRMRRRGPKSAHEHPDWGGGRTVDKNGYILVFCPGHPMARSPQKKYVLEHRLVMSQHLGRLLKSSEVVHHKNGLKTDNRIENLELFSSNADHLAKTIKGQCPKWTEDGKRRIREGVRRSLAKRSSGRTK